MPTLLKRVLTIVTLPGDPVFISLSLSEHVLKVASQARSSKLKTAPS
jgi:hypothetical protein